MSFSQSIEIVPLKRPPQVAVSVPGSKSITNRALVLAALKAKGYVQAIRGALRSEDTEIMVECLRTLGFRILTEWHEQAIFVSSGLDEPTIPADSATLFVGNSGTTMRFLTAMVSLGHGRYRLDGVPRMRERPIEDLLVALRQLGVHAYSEKNNGCPPVIVEARGLAGGHVNIKGDLSSQFLTGLLLAAPYADDLMDVEIDGSLVSRPYVDMTLRMLRHWGHTVVETDAGFRFLPDGGNEDELVQRRIDAAAFHDGFDPRHHTLLEDYCIEPDASAASYFLAAAAISGGRVTVLDLPANSLQGDVAFVDVLADMGCRVERCSSGITVHGRPLRGIDVDMNGISDTVMTLGAVACFADGPTTIRNVGHIRHKETDRLSALATELRRIGAEVEEFTDGLTITPGPLHGAEIETYNDHRMAMSLALVGLNVPGIVIKDPRCVGKTYPEFFRDLERLRE
ncbi:MAG: 3-phosphoshikimate 1-carboxyvinyltransferase [Planctomycetes bacterium]|nr:3-phosphoshikimate 1-carboxyvinyltransferase [Planctomycetota bacterium]